MQVFSVDKSYKAFFYNLHKCLAQQCLLNFFFVKDLFCNVNHFIEENYLIEGNHLIERNHLIEGNHTMTEV